MDRQLGGMLDYWKRPVIEICLTERQLLCSEFTRSNIYVEVITTNINQYLIQMHIVIILWQTVDENSDVLLLLS